MRDMECALILHLSPFSCNSQVGKKALWPVLGLMRDTIHGEDIKATLDDMDEKGTAMSVSPGSAKVPAESKSRTGSGKAGRKRSRAD